jgi:isocitrate lyase
VLKKQTALLRTVAMPQVPSSRRASWQSDDTTRALAHLLSVTGFYSNLIAQTGAHTAKDAMKIVAKEVEKDGLHVGTKDMQEHEEPS